ncbi:hypothetical protein KP509_35G056900 [Ceratopteris richardii]|uniref:Peroxidase n=1 Tax=Ceratopteris richardii TaxID=49495 RepID=A0A8T2QHB2_CERRI|nr:hypothetical protein KP509_35G056900 [Ceratopteris richardii]
MTGSLKGGCLRSCLEVLLVLLLSHHGCAAAATRVGYYQSSCPSAEDIVKQAVEARFAMNRTITGGLLRMFFHDCFVTGCDASLLIDSTPGNEAEKDAPPNLTVREFELIDNIKTRLEAVCPGVVSCADIIALAVRDAVVLAGGPKYAVKTGRLDGKLSRSADANILPSPASTVQQAMAAFASQGLSLTDLVALMGSHTTGFAHCSFFRDRVFNFEGNGTSDPKMDTDLAEHLRSVCSDPADGGSTKDASVALDQGTRDAFDASYFAQVRNGHGILQIDNALLADARTSALVDRFSSNPSAFFQAFVQSITTMGDLHIKTEADGELVTQTADSTTEGFSSYTQFRASRVSAALLPTIYTNLSSRHIPRKEKLVSYGKHEVIAHKQAVISCTQSYM